MRIQQGLYQSQVAKMAGITAQSFSYIELSERRPSVDVAKKIAKALGFNWTRFFEDDPQPNETEAI